MTKHLCQIPECRNHGRYCRIHPTDIEPEKETRDKKYQRIRKEFMKDHKKCEVPGCTKDAKDVHHKAGRTGSLLFDTSLFMAVCRGCHLWIEAHPNTSKELGYSISRHSKKEKV
jgi:hypothetical protein